MKNLRLGGGTAFQQPLLENPNFFYKNAFFHLCSQRLGVVCVVFYNVLCCLNFGVWI